MTDYPPGPIGAAQRAAASRDQRRAGRLLLDQHSDASLAKLYDRAEQAETALATLALILEGFGRLLATSSRDWQPYRVDAWLYAVILGWDCEETVHDGTCTHGALEETAAMHGWDEATVAKARRYRAAVRALPEPEALKAPTGATFTEPARHIGQGENAEDCPACTGTNPPYPFLCPGNTPKESTP